MHINPKYTENFLVSEDFNKYVIGGSTFSDKKWGAYLKDHPETKQGAEKARGIILGLISMKDIISDSELDEFKLYHNFEETWKEYKGAIPKSAIPKYQKLIWRCIAVAAAIVFAILFYSLTNNFAQRSIGLPLFSEIYVPAAKQSKLILPDGTNIWLNSDTKIKYSTQFNSKERNVYLDGEAYFEVAHNKKLFFNVFSKGAQIKVLGTKFNVKSYPDDEKLETVLVEGKIELSRANVKNSRSIEIKPGDKAILDFKTNKVTITRKDIDIDLTWKEGKIIFRNTPLADVCKSLMRWYNVEIVLADDTGELLVHPFTFTVVNEPLPLVLEYLCQAAPLNLKTEYIDVDGEKGIEKIKYTIQPNK